MLENPSTMTDKVIFYLSPAAKYEKSNFLQAIYTLICESLRQELSLDLDWDRLQSGLRYKTEDESVQLHSAYFEEEGGRLLWAVKVRVRDKTNRRRSWITHIGLSMDTPNAATLYFARLCCDHQAGSLLPPKPIITDLPILPSLILASRRLCCLCGSYPMPTQPWALTDADINDFINLLFDPDRNLPLVMITCPDLLPPCEVFARTAGNLIVCWLDDYELHDSLIKYLPPELQIPWDTMRVYMPINENTANVFHPTFTLSDITRLGSNGLIESLYRAFCASFRGEDRRAFVDLDTVFARMRERSYTQAEDLATQLLEQRECLVTENIALASQCEELRKKSMEAEQRLANADISEYESLLAECMKELDHLKAGINELTARLYADMGDSFAPDAFLARAEIRDLALAIRACLDRGHGRR